MCATTASPCHRDDQQVLPLDHLVINTRFAIAQAAQLFEKLGFTVTPQSRHTLGSVNHLMVFETGYLELIGLPDDGGLLRQEILDSPVGMDGLVFQDNSVDTLVQRLGDLGQALQPVGQFSRPVVLENDTQEASFRTARFTPGLFAAGRVYYCQHLTPELIWRAPWQQHANTANRLAGLTIVSNDPAQAAQAYAQAAVGARVTQVSSDKWQVACRGFTLTLCSASVYAQRFGGLALADSRSDFFGAIEIEVDSLDRLLDTLPMLGEQVQWQQGDQGLTVKLLAFDAVLDFAEVGANPLAPIF